MVDVATIYELSEATRTVLIRHAGADEQVLSSKLASFICSHYSVLTGKVTLNLSGFLTIRSGTRTNNVDLAFSTHIFELVKSVLPRIRCIRKLLEYWIGLIKSVVGKVLFR